MNAPTLRHPYAAGTRRQRAASLKTVLGHRLHGLLAGIWSALEDTARLQAASQLLREASRLQVTDPGLSASLRALAAVPKPSHSRASTLARAA